MGAEADALTWKQNKVYPLNPYTGVDQLVVPGFGLAKHRGGESQPKL